MIDVLIPDSLSYITRLYPEGKFKIFNKIFNYILIYEFIINDELFHKNNIDSNKITNHNLNKYEIYIESIKFSTRNKESLINYNRNHLQNQEKFSLSKNLLTISELYCFKQKDKCEERILTFLNVKELKKIILTSELRSKILDNL